MKTRKYALAVGALSLAWASAYAQPAGYERVYWNAAFQWPWVDVPVTELRRDIEEGVTAAVVSAGSTLAQPADRARFSPHSVARDIVARWNPYVTAATIAYASKTNNATVQSVAIEAGINLAPQILTTAAQEYFQLFLRNRYGIGEQKARWAALGVASAVLGSWQYWARPYFQQQLAQKFSGHAMSSANGDLRRRLLAIDYGESFAYQLRARPTVTTHWTTRLSDGGDRIFFAGSTVSAWGTPHTWRVWVDMPPPSPYLKTKKITSCNDFAGQAPICRIQYAL